MSESTKSTLSKGIIIKNKGKCEYLAKDVFNDKEILIEVTGKAIMYYCRLEKGDIVYYEEGKLSSGKYGCRLVTSTTFKTDRHLFSLKIAIDKRYDERKTK